MRAEDLQYLFRTRAIADARARDALADIPVPAVESAGPAVEGVAVHRACDYGIRGQYDEPGAEDAAVVELGMGQDAARGGADGEVVGVGPAFLQRDDVRWWLRDGDLVPDLGEARGAEGGDVFEAPAVEGEEIEFLGGGVGRGWGGHGWWR